MLWLLERKEYTSNSTIGDLYLEGKFQCYTLEDRDRYLEKEGNEKVAGNTAIPRGEYRIIIDYSTRFKQKMPLLLDVPLFTGIRIHPGNTAEDTEGCILVGKEKRKDTIVLSKLAFTPLFNKLIRANSKEKIWIKVI